MGPEADLRELAKRRASTTLEGCHSLAEFHDGAYECEYVSPYSKSAHCTDSGVLIFLQDWISADVLAGPLIPEAVAFGRVPSLPTNRNLERLLEVGLALEISQTYTTNLFPFIKAGGMSAPIPTALLRWSAREYGLPHIRILAPRLVVALGLATFNALCAAMNRRSTSKLAEAIASPFMFEGSMVWCQAHPGALGQNTRNRRRRDQTEADWRAMGSWFRASEGD